MNQQLKQEWQNFLTDTGSWSLLQKIWKLLNQKITSTPNGQEIIQHMHDSGLFGFKQFEDTVTANIMNVEHFNFSLWGFVNLYHIGKGELDLDSIHMKGPYYIEDTDYVKPNIIVENSNDNRILHEKHLEIQIGVNEEAESTMNFYCNLCYKYHGGSVIEQFSFGKGEATFNKEKWFKILEEFFSAPLPSPNISRTSDVIHVLKVRYW